jgi:2-iminobutanoate/2-iminopropanoate deaminase
MEEIATENAPESIGPYSQGIKHGDTVYVSGQGPIDPDSGEVIDGDVAAQTERTLENVAAILAAAGTGLDSVLKVTVYLDDTAAYGAVNEVYQEYMTDPFPARSAVEAAEFPIDVDIEIEAIATVES